MTDDDSVDEHSGVRERLAAEPSPAMPDDVAAQLHAALERESRSRQESYAEPVPLEENGSVVPLRRRRWKAPLAAAATVVAVVAIGIPVVNQMDVGGSEDGASGGSSQADSAPKGSGGSKSGPSNAAPDVDSGGNAGDSVSELTRADFAADVRALLAESDALSMTAPSAIRSAVACASGNPSTHRGIAASLDGRPVVVLTSAESAGSPTVTARAVTCGPEGPRVAARAAVTDPR